MDIDAELEKNRGDSHLGDGEDDRFWGNQGAGVLVRAADTGRYLLLLRSADVNEPHTWHMASGQIDEGEDPQQAAQREMEEETGYHGPITLKLVDTFEHGTFKFFNFLGEVPHEFDIPRYNWESEDHVWAAKEDFPQPLHFGLKRILGLFESVCRKTADFLALFEETSLLDKQHE